MREHISIAAAAVLSVAMLPTADAQSDDDFEEDEDDEEDLGPPPELEILDVTKGMRTDIPLTAALAPDDTLYVGTLNGRIYRSKNRRDWDELTVLPEVKALYGFAGQLLLLGHIRDDSGVRALPLNLIPGLGVVPLGMSQLHGPWTHAYNNDLGTGGFGIGGAGATLSLTGGANAHGGSAANTLGSASEAALAGGGLVAGAGLSARAPRLSILQQTRQRPVATVNKQTFLLSRLRTTNVNRIAIDPNNPDHLFAATRYGLYESQDGGGGWVRIFPGVTALETVCVEIYYDPHRPDRLYLGTGKGMFVSEDNGLSFSKHGFVPETQINKVAVDPEDPNYIYVATLAGTYRSTDGGESFSLAFFSSLPLQNQNFWVDVDRNDPERIYLGTADGIFTTDRGRTVGPTDWTLLAALRTLNLFMPTVKSCPDRPGMIYAQSSANLPVNLYHGNSPEGYLLVSYDYGKTFEVAVSNRSFGTIGWFEVDPKNCHRLWVLFSNAVLEVRPKGSGGPSGRSVDSVPRDPDLPTMSEVLLAALGHWGIELEEYTRRIKKSESARWLPVRLNATASWNRWQVGARTDDFQFAEERYLSRHEFSELRIMAWASWDFHGMWFDQRSVPLLRERVRHMNDEMRRRAMATVFRHYRELLDLRTRRRAGLRRRTLEQRASDRVLEDQHFAVVDVATGGFLSRWIEQRSKR
jgi:hypothetical protein